MGLKKLFSLLLVMAVLLLPAAGCGGEKEYDAIELVPEGADMIVGVQITEAISKWDLYSEGEEEPEMSELFEETMDEFVGQLGVDPRDISEMVLFADMSAIETGDFMAFILVGDFDNGNLIDIIEEEAGMEFTTSEYGDYTLYIDQRQDAAVVIISKKMIIIGSIDAVKDCIDVAGGKVKRVSGAVMDTYSALGGAMVRLAMAVPEEFKESFTEEPVEAPLPIAMEAFADIQTLGLALDQDAEVMTIKANLGFGDAQSAEDAADSLETMIDFIGMMSPEEETRDLLERIEIRASGSRVNINFEVSLSELEKLGESFMSQMLETEQIPVPPEIPEFDE